MVNHKKAQAIAVAALSRSPEDRASYLDAACGEDAALRRAVEELMARRGEGLPATVGAVGGDDSEDQSHRTPIVSGAWPSDTVSETPLPGAGSMLGPYQLVEKIGEGGFGSVWMAQQREPMTRQVALKIIKLGMDTREVVARFEGERQTLALLNHPGIAKVFDAGRSETGRPYFVMELVSGVPIVRYCDEQRLNVRARLELFIKVCQAIQHAHQKGIIHRDIKPSNVLVTEQDGAPPPKVIDFGIAKATKTELLQRTFFTEHRVFLGTPAYMSPEQAEMTGEDIDTRSDIYSLGVLLYEMLAGALPFDLDEVRLKGFSEMMRVLREVEPPRPSSRVLKMGEPAAMVAAARRLEVRSLAGALRGDLDWIVMRCLEKDRARRYPSANALAEDVRRHLEFEPVAAGAP